MTNVEGSQEDGTGEREVEPTGSRYPTDEELLERGLQYPSEEELAELEESLLLNDR